MSTTIGRRWLTTTSRAEGGAGGARGRARARRFRVRSARPPRAGSASRGGRRRGSAILGSGQGCVRQRAPRVRVRSRAEVPAREPTSSGVTVTLVFDIGGHVDQGAMRFDALGRALGRRGAAHGRRPRSGERRRRCSESSAELARATWSRFERVAAGFPGVVRDGVVRTAPNLASRARGPAVDLARDLERACSAVPARVDERRGPARRWARRAGAARKLLLTLGTGLGSVLLVDRRALPLELGHLPWRRGRTFEESLGEGWAAARGHARGARFVVRAVATLRAALEPDVVCWAAAMQRVCADARRAACGWWRTARRYAAAGAGTRGSSARAEDEVHRAAAMQSAAQR